MKFGDDIVVPWLRSDQEPPESTRQDVIESPQRISEEKYVAQMPNGAFCVIKHENQEVVKCFKTRKEAEDFLSNMKKESEVEEAEVEGGNHRREFPPYRDFKARRRDTFGTPWHTSGRHCHTRN